MREIGGPRKYPFKFKSTPTEVINIMSTNPDLFVIPIGSNYTYESETYGTTTISGVNDYTRTGAYRVLVFTDEGTYKNIDLAIYYHVTGRYWKKWDEEV